MNLRRLDHLNLLAVDIPAIRDFHTDVLGARLTEVITFDDGSDKGVSVGRPSLWFSVNKRNDNDQTKKTTGCRRTFSRFSSAQSYLIDYYTELAARGGSQERLPT